MTAEEILQVIHENCLSVRRIAPEDWQTVDIAHYREGDTITTLTVDQVHPNSKTYFAKHFPNGRKFCRRRIIHDTDGHYMVQKVTDRGSICRWDYKRDFGAPTLQESISLFLKYNERAT